MRGSFAPELTHQRVTWIWRCENESDAAASLLMFPATCADVIWKCLALRGTGGSAARLTHERVDIRRNGPLAGHLPSKLARSWVIPIYRNEVRANILPSPGTTCARGTADVLAVTLRRGTRALQATATQVCAGGGIIPSFQQGRSRLHRLS